MVSIPFASATKTGVSPINFTMLFSDWRLGGKSMYAPGEKVAYNITIENPNSCGDHNVKFNATFPDAVTCFAVAPQSGCTLSGNRLSCGIASIHPKQKISFAVYCQVNSNATCDSNARASATITSAKTPSANGGYLDFQVKCAAPTATPTAHCSPTPVPPTPTPVCTETPVPPTPTVCSDPHDSDALVCETYSIERKVYERWSRKRVRPVTIREEVEVLPAGKELACLEQALKKNAVQCLSYHRFGACTDHLLWKHLAREGSRGRCFGVSNMTNWLLNQACEQDSSSTQCTQFLALNSYQSNNYPMGSETTGVDLCDDHNPRSQVFIIDAQCRLILNPTEEQKAESCPAAIIRGQAYHQDAYKPYRRQ